MEIEAKYALTRPLEPSDLEAVDLHLYRLRQSGDERHHDVLLDTPAHALTSRRHALRLRRFADGRVVATLKGSNAGSGAIHEREEIEAPLPDGTADVHPRFPPEIAQRIHPLTGDTPLIPLIENDIHRQTWQVLRDEQPVAEMALDEGSISANGLTMPVRELEIEIKDAGTRDDLEELGRLLSRQLPLAPEPRTKLERGLELLERGRLRAARRPLEEVVRAAVARHLQDVRKHEPEVREDTDPEAVHKMRVATRRLRTTLRSVEAAPAFAPGRLRRLQRGLKRLAAALGEVRDLDILSERVRAYGEAQPDLAPDLARLRDLLAERRKAARTRLLACLGSSKLARTLDELDALASRPDSEAEEPPLLVRHFAGSAIWARYEAVMRFETVAPEAPPPVLHQIRIACKQLRYDIELFEDALGPRARPLLDLLVQAQDHLGTLHDAVVTLDLEGQVRKRQSAAGLAIYAAALAAERDQLQRAFAPLWARLSGPELHDDLLAAVGGL